MTTPWDIEIAQRKNNHYHYMRAILFNGYGEMIVRFKFKSWK